MKLSKFLCILAASTILAGTFVGCSSSNGQTSTTTTTTTTTESETPQENEQAEHANPYLATEKPIKLTVHMGTKDSGVFNSEWAIFKIASELTNVTLEGTLPDTLEDFS